MAFLYRVLKDHSSAAILPHSSVASTQWDLVFLTFDSVPHNELLISWVCMVMVAELTD